MRLDYTHLRERVYQLLKREILESRITPGTKLKELELASRLGVSRTPVREAIQMLGQDGLVEVVPRYGVFVKDLRVADLKGIFEIREVLEGLAARLATQSENRKLAQKLSKLYEGIEKKDFANLERMSQLNRKFHDILISASGNEKLVSILNNLHDALFLAQIRTLPSEERARISYNEHLAIIKAVEENKPETAEALLHGHIHRAAMLRLEEPGSSTPKTERKPADRSLRLLSSPGRG